MTVVVAEGPDIGAALPLSIVKDHLRVDDAGEDVLIGAMRDAAFAHLDGPAGWLGRALAPQTLQAWLDGWPCTPWDLPYGPVTDIVSIEYTDTAGAEQALPGDQYRLTAGGALDRTHGASWPSARAQADAVCITYEAGYATLPAPIVSALLLMIGDLYANRETGVIGTVTAEVRMAASVQALLAPFRVWKL